MRSGLKKIFFIVSLVLLVFGAEDIFAQVAPTGEPNLPMDMPKLSVDVDFADDNSDLVLTLQMITIMTVLTLAPSILVMMTCFTRIIVVFHFLKSALGTNTQPPNQVLTGLALFLTYFVMQPVLDEANATGIQPYIREEISQEQAVINIVEPFRQFMLSHTDEKDLALFIKLSGDDKPYDVNEVSTWQIIPAYTISELRVAFQIGFLLFVPFLVLDMIVASTLMSLGMFLLPPQLISLPVKILLFIIIDGWYLVIESLMRSIMT